VRQSQVAGGRRAAVVVMFAVLVISILGVSGVLGESSPSVEPPENQYPLDTLCPPDTTGSQVHSISNPTGSSYDLLGEVILIVLQIF
jgi:hypothetical protein